MNYARFARFPEEVLHARNLSLADRIVYAEMSFQAWYKDTCCISQAKIAARLGISTRQVKRSQSKLEAERYITAVETGHKRVSTYHLNSRVFSRRKQPFDGDIMSPKNASNGDILSPYSRKNKKSPHVN